MSEHAARSSALSMRMGNAPGVSFMVRVVGDDVVVKRIAKNVVEGHVATFERAAIKFGGKTGQRMFVLEPADDEDEFVFGEFFVRGRYRVAEKINNPAAAAERWRSFVGSPTGDTP